MINKPQTDFFVEVTEVLRPRIWMELAQKLGYDVTSTAQKRNNFIMNFHITMLILWTPWLILAGHFLYRLFTF